MTGPGAAGDFDAIRTRREELRRERGPAPSAEAPEGSAPCPAFSTAKGVRRRGGHGSVSRRARPTPLPPWSLIAVFSKKGLGSQWPNPFI